MPGANVLAENGLDIVGTGPGITGFAWVKLGTGPGITGFA
jgi:hypothetical protein